MLRVPLEELVPPGCATAMPHLGFSRAFRQAPEMLRVPLEELVLQIHLLRLGRAGAFLATVLEPPPERSVAAAVEQLQAIGALTPAEKLTPLGESKPPTTPHLSVLHAAVPLACSRT